MTSYVDEDTICSQGGVIGVCIQQSLVLLIGAVADNWNYNASNPCLHCGGNYNQNQNHGLFYVNYNNASNTNANIGCRILVFARPHQR